MEKGNAGIVSHSNHKYVLGQRVQAVYSGQGTSDMYSDNIGMDEGEEGVIVGVDGDETQILLDSGNHVVRSEKRAWQYIKLIKDAPKESEVINNYSLY